jgi:hypothetical protein
MLHEYHVIYRVHYYLQFHATAVGLGTYYPQIQGALLYFWCHEAVFPSRNTYIFLVFSFGFGMLLC